MVSWSIAASVLLAASVNLNLALATPIQAYQPKECAKWSVKHIPTHSVTHHPVEVNTEIWRKGVYTISGAKFSVHRAPTHIHTRTVGTFTVPCTTTTSICEKYTQPPVGYHTTSTPYNKNPPAYTTKKTTTSPYYNNPPSYTTTTTTTPPYYYNPVVVTTIVYISPDQAPYTNTVSNYGAQTETVVIGVPEIATTTTEYLAPDAAPFTSTITGVPGHETIEIGIPEMVTTTTEYLAPDAAPFTSTFTNVPGHETIEVGIPELITTVTVPVAFNSAPYTTTEPMVGPTETVVVGVCPTLDTSCGNSGFAFAVQPSSDKQTNENFNDVVVDYFKTDAPEVTGTTSAIGFSYGNAATYSFYGTAPQTAGMVAVNHRGYFYAQLPGIYTFQLTDSDNEVYVWAGDDAYTAYEQSNAVVDAEYAGAGYPTATGTYTVTEACSLVPFRVLFVNTDGPGELQVSITGPDGTVVLSGAASNYLITQSCDGTTAPAFPAFGAETGT